MKQALVQKNKQGRKSRRFSYQGETYKVGTVLNKEVIKEVVNIQKSQGLTPQNLVERAKNKSNPLHNLFLWDNDKAGEKYRLFQATQIINEIQVEIKGSLFPRYESVIVVRKNGTPRREYYDNNQIISNEELRKQMLHIALSHLEGWKTKFQYYNELKPIVISIDTTKEKLEKRWQRKNKK